LKFAEVAITDEPKYPSGEKKQGIGGFRAIYIVVG